MKEISITFAGVGQAGNRLANTFGENFKACALNTAYQDLGLDEKGNVVGDALGNIPQDYRIFTKINNTGGAGKDVKKGEYAIRKHEEKILKKLERFVSGSDYTFLCAGLGGGTGTQGVVQLSRLLSKLGRKHGIIATLPSAEEGTYAHVNAPSGVYMIEKARKQFNNLKGILVPDNNIIKKLVLKNDDLNHNDIWQEVNNIIYDDFMSFYNLSKTSGEQNVDTTDFQRLLNMKGYICIGRTRVTDIKNQSEEILVNATHDILDNNRYCVGDIKQAKGVSLLINKPESFESDGRKIHNLKKEIKNYFGPIHFAPGVYQTKQNFFGKFKSIFGSGDDAAIELFTLVCGLPAPKKRFQELNKIAQKEHHGLTGKEDEFEFNYDKSMLDSLVDDEGKKEESDLALFDEDFKTKESLDFSVLEKKKKVK